MTPLEAHHYKLQLKMEASSNPNLAGYKISTLQMKNRPSKQQLDIDTYLALTDEHVANFDKVKHDLGLKSAVALL